VVAHARRAGIHGARAQGGRDGLRAFAAEEVEECAVTDQLREVKVLRNLEAHACGRHRLRVVRGDYRSTGVDADYPAM